MKSYSSTHPNVRDQYYRNNFIAVDLVELYIPTITNTANTQYLTNAGIPITYSGHTYTALGEFMGFSTVSEDFDVKVGKFSVYLSGLGNNYISQFVYQDPTTGQRINLEGRRVVIRKAFLDKSNGLTIFDTPIVIFDGIIYNIAINESAVSSQITIECSTLFADFERNAGRKTNNASNWQFQGSTYDLAFQQAGFVGNTEYKWGKL
jgi:hypothetical protein